MASKKYIYYYVFRSNVSKELHLRFYENISNSKELVKEFAERNKFCTLLFYSLRKFECEAFLKTQKDFQKKCLDNNNNNIIFESTNNN